MKNWANLYLLSIPCKKQRENTFYTFWKITVKDTVRKTSLLKMVHSILLTLPCSTDTCFGYNTVIKETQMVQTTQTFSVFKFEITLLKKLRHEKSTLIMEWKARMSQSKISMVNE